MNAVFVILFTLHYISYALGPDRLWGQFSLLSNGIPGFFPWG